ncbi:helix-turn-helix domain-containing protein [Fulvivirgaceae bacterium BMA10]|uniref:Helix-turn-helix domain-containing protein n=1 Tax=Splendidivirga corallicola TaxID=3051826 RepID=A0ABT8KV81_9BACT|nr:helix-turn-helix domain-containing protein [Fulvivirgaceae bacterium BMA10]
MIFKVSPITLLEIVSCSLAVMLGLLFLTRKFNNRRANIFLGIFLFSLAIEIVSPIIDAINELNQTNLDFPFTSSLFTLPLLLFYIVFTINKEINKKWYLLFLPGIVINLASVHDHIYLRQFEYAFNAALLFWMINIIKSHGHRVLDYYSSTEHKLIKWLYTIIVIFLLFQVIWISEDLLLFSEMERFGSLLSITSTLLTGFLIYWVAYNGFTQQELFSGEFIRNEVEVKRPKEDSIEKIPTTEEKSLFERINGEVNDGKLYTNADLSLRVLSEAMDISEKKLSYLINTCTQTNYYTYINTFRIAEFKRLAALEDSKNLSILGIAQNAGFSSKSTFYKAFKELEGITPREYLSNKS